MRSASIGMEADRMRRAVVARRGSEHVLALRRDDEIVVQSLWSQRETLDDVVSAPLWAAMRPTADAAAPPPAEIDPVTWSLDQVRRLAEASAPGEMIRTLRSQWSVEPHTARVLNEVSEYSGLRCEIVMREDRGITSVETPAGVFVADTSYGRVISAVRKQGSQIWVTYGPGTYARFRAAMADLVGLTPGRNWFAAGVEQEFFGKG